MPTEEQAYRAQQADRLVNHEPLLVEALTNIRIRALNDLATVDPTKADDIRRYQAKVAVTEDILVELQEIIILGSTGEPQPEQSTAAN